MRELLSDDRRRRLRLIQTVEELSEKKFHSAISALTIASETEATRHDLELMRHQLIGECRPDPSMKLRVELKGASSVEVNLDRPYLVIGSDPDCDLHLDHEEVCPRHLILLWIEGQLFCCNISSSNSHFPGPETASPGWWVDHIPFEVGPYRLSLTERMPAPSDFSPLERSQRLSTEYPLLALQFDGVAQKDNTWPINRVLTLIGRDAACRLRLNHNSVAPVHACLFRTTVGCWLIDLANNGTTLINGRTVPVSSVDIGDELQLGNFYTEVVTLVVPTSTVQGISERLATSNSSPAIQPKLDSLETSPTISVPVMITTDPADMVIEEAIEPTANADAIAQFIQQQQWELAAMKSQLEELKQAYDAAAGQIISKKLRDSLEKSVLEILKSYDSLEMNLSNLIQAVEHKIE